MDINIASLDLTGLALCDDSYLVVLKFSWDLGAGILDLGVCGALVLDEGVLGQELFVALVALVGPDPVDGGHVPRHRAEVCEGRVALRADVVALLPLAGVVDEVLAEGLLALEALAAVFAGERLEVGVSRLVLEELALGVEAGVASSAVVQLNVGVELHVVCEDALLGKHSKADKALVTFCAGSGVLAPCCVVNLHMVRPGSFSFEGLAADVAAERLVLGVARLMFGQEMFVLKAFAAHFTDIRFGSGMVLHVDSQAARVVELRIADRADELLLVFGFIVRCLVSSHVIS